jgi:hypothetical protein
MDVSSAVVVPQPLDLLIFQFEISTLLPVALKISTNSSSVPDGPLVRNSLITICGGDTACLGAALTGSLTSEKAKLPQRIAVSRMINRARQSFCDLCIRTPAGRRKGFLPEL